MTYAIITGAHFFPYAWFYNTKWYAFFAGIISIGALLIALTVTIEQQYYIGIWTATCLFVLALGLITDYRKKMTDS